MLSKKNALLIIFVTVLQGIFCSLVVEAVELPIPYPVIDAPVVHSGRYHLLTSGRTFVVLDEKHGMSIAMIGSKAPHEKADSDDAVICNASLHARVECDGKVLELDQVNDSSARIEIIDQGKKRVAARIFFTMLSKDYLPYGTGTLDIYVYDQSVFLAPSVYVDDSEGETMISRAGLFGEIPGNNAVITVNGANIVPAGDSMVAPFGDDKEDFHMLVENPGRSSFKMGWMRNVYPDRLYSRQISENPEVDELYERFPYWITQRGAQIGWKRTEKSGLEMKFSNDKLDSFDLLWVNDEPIVIPKGGYSDLNGLMALFFGDDSAKTEKLWSYHELPIKPDVTNGDFRYYNEIEGTYEIDSQGGDVDLTFNTGADDLQRPFSVRLWNLKGSGAYEVNVNGSPAAFNLINDGDLRDDPMVPIMKTATGPARYATVAFAADRGLKTRLTVKRKPGIQFTYQMYSNLETYEAWSDVCTNRPLFRLYTQKSSIYHAALPAKETWAMAKLPLFWLKNGTNPATFMDHVRDFTVHENGPDRITFTITCVNLHGTGLSSYTVTVPYEKDHLQFDITAEFTPLDREKRWNSLEYCDLYPFDNYYRRTFHYDDVFFLDRHGVFDRVGTGAWDGFFEVFEEPEYLGYYGVIKQITGPGTRIPDPADGTVWILGNNARRGNILYRRGDWSPSEGATPGFSLCNAWVDIHNYISRRTDSAAGEKITYTVELFGGPVPSLEKLNSMYRKSARERSVQQITRVNYSNGGIIQGFEVK